MRFRHVVREALTTVLFVLTDIDVKKEWAKHMSNFSRLDASIAKLGTTIATDLSEISTLLKAKAVSNDDAEISALADRVDAVTASVDNFVALAAPPPVTVPDTQTAATDPGTPQQ